MSSLGNNGALLSLLLQHNQEQQQQALQNKYIDQVLMNFRLQQLLQQNTQPPSLKRKHEESFDLMSIGGFGLDAPVQKLARSIPTPSNLNAHSDIITPSNTQVSPLSLPCASSLTSLFPQQQDTPKHSMLLTEPITTAPDVSRRIKGMVYQVRGQRKKWDGRRFARCCDRPGCNKLAQGTTTFCKAHGGGTRCSAFQCDRAARGGSEHCAMHGGGKRCTVDGCDKAAIGADYCRRHGGGRQCQADGCVTSARGKTKFCVAHGGGARCQVVGCDKAARAGSEGARYCRRHGGGRRCSVPNCTKSSKGKSAFCMGHWQRFQASGNTPILGAIPDIAVPLKQMPYSPTTPPSLGLGSELGNTSSQGIANASTLNTRKPFQYLGEGVVLPMRSILQH